MAETTRAFARQGEFANGNAIAVPVLWRIAQGRSISLLRGRARVCAKNSSHTPGAIIYCARTAENFLLQMENIYYIVNNFFFVV